MPDQIEISGLTELRSTLLRLPLAVQGRASQSALAKAARPIVAMAKQLAPMSKGSEFVGPTKGKQSTPPGMLKRSIYAFRNRRSTKTYESRYIGVRSGRGKAWWWKFVEFGRGAMTSDKSLGRPDKGFFGKSIRAMPARPFLRPAFEALKLRAIDIYAKALKPAVEKYAQKEAAKSVRRLRKRITGF